MLTPFADLLQAQWGACYRLALALVGEASAAEDVTQEALLAAFESQDRFDRGRELKPWLFGIVHKRALMHHRGRKRRAAREERVARPELAEAPAGLEASEQARLIREHLHALEPKLRHALALRYLEGLSLAQVAEALGVPQGTVSSRVRRGLQALERSLVPALGLTGAALLAALGLALREVVVPPLPDALARLGPGPGAPGGPTPPAGPTPSSGPTPAVAAPRHLGRAAGLLGAFGLLGLAAALLLLEPPPPPDASAAGSPSASVGATSAPTSAPGGSRAESGEPLAGGQAAAHASPAGPGGPDAAATVRGRVRAVDDLRDAWVHPVDPQDLQRLLGSPLQGGDEAAARALLGRDRFGWNVPAASTPLDADGAFALALTPGEHLLAIGARGCRTRLLTVTAPLGEPLDVDLEWLFPAEVALRVADADGLTYDHAYASLTCREVQQAVWVDGLEAWAETLPDGSRLVRSLRSAALGRVPLDGRGEARLALPAGDYTLALQLWAGVREPSSIAPFASGSLPRVTQALALEAGARVPWEAAVDWRDGAYAGRLARVDVEVVDGQGRPVAGAYVQLDQAPGARYLAGLRERGSTACSWVTGSDGRARLFGLEQEHAFGVAARQGGRWTGFGQALVTGPAYAAGEPVPVRRLVLDQPFVVGGLRLDLRDAETGQPPRSEGLAVLGQSSVAFAAAWSVDLLTGEDQPEPGLSGWVPEPDGRLRIDELPPGRWVLRVSQPSAPRGVSYLETRLEAEVRAGEVTDVRVPLRRGATLVGQLLVGGEPAASQGVADVTLYDADFRSPGQASLDAEGRFAISGLEPGRRYRLFVGARTGVFPAQFDDVVASAEPQVFELPGEVALDVRVTDARGQPLEGAFVHWELPGTSFTGTLETDPLGQAQWRGRLLREAVVRVTRFGYLLREERAGPGPTRLDVTLEPDPDAAVVAGRVVDEAGQPLAGVRVSISNPTTVTDAQGRFELRVHRGRGVLYAEAEGYVREQRELDVPAEGLPDLALTLARGARIRGRIVAPAERLPRLRAGFRIVLPGGELSDFERFRVDDAGGFTTKRACPGWEVVVQLIDRDRQVVVVERRLQLVPGEDVDLELGLPAEGE